MRDFLNGGAGHDVLKGDSGDHLHGGTGIDTFSFEGASGAIFEDFDPAEDVIEIAYFDAPPELSTGASDAGLTLLADGDLVATFSNLDDLDVTIVSLVTA